MTEPAPQAVDQEPEYSKAFERFVDGPADVVGLLAYALFKEAVREAAQQGAKTDPATRSPVPAMIEVYRQAAEQRIGVIISDAIAQATPDIQASAAVSAVRAAQEASIAAVTSAEVNLKSYLDERTSFKSAMLTSFAGWLLTLGVTAIIIFLAGRASVEEMVRSAVTRANAVPAQADEPQQRSSRQ